VLIQCLLDDHASPHHLRQRVLLWLLDVLDVLMYLLLDDLFLLLFLLT
jgi:hypothetical protein